MEKGPYGRGYYSGDLRIDEYSLKVKYGSGKTIFIDHCNDLFAKDVPDDWIDRVMFQCRSFNDNTYVFQSKNPERMWQWVKHMPKLVMLGTTIETDTYHAFTWDACCPSPYERLKSMFMHKRQAPTFITIEPIMRMFSPSEFARGIANCMPTFVNVGADSKGSKGLSEPTGDEVREFIAALRENGVTISKKSNLERLLK